MVMSIDLDISLGLKRPYLTREPNTKGRRMLLAGVAASDQRLKVVAGGRAG